MTDATTAGTDGRGGTAGAVGAGRELSLDDVPPLHGPRPAGAASVRRRVPADRGPWPRPGRRTVLGGMVAAGGTLGLTALGVFRPAREALADGFALPSAVEGYAIYPKCPAYAEPHNCSPGCGPSLVCASCCRTSGSAKGFHHSSASKAGYRLRPNQCYSGGWDGWKWAYAKPCGKCKKSVTWRCHDGWKRNSKGAYYKTICRWALSCAS